MFVLAAVSASSVFASASLIIIIVFCLHSIMVCRALLQAHRAPEVLNAMQGFSFVGINTVAVNLTGQATFEAGV